MQFFPERWAKVYDHWMEGIQDWCISRQLWWGHRIPVWHRRVTINDYQLDADVFGLGGLMCTPEENEKAGRVVRVIRVRDGAEVNPAEHSFRTSETKDDRETFDVFVATADEENGRLLEKHGFTQDSDVLDTWFSSWLWPFATMGWPEKTDTLAKFYPTTDLVTGPDIIFFWVARMIMAGFEYMGETAVQERLFHRHHPRQTGAQNVEVARQFTRPARPHRQVRRRRAALRRDAQRAARQRIFSSTKRTSSSAGTSARSSGTPRASGRCRAARPRRKSAPMLLTSDDKWILLRLDAAIARRRAALDEYRFSDAANALYRFFWSEYCDWYLEAARRACRTARRRRESGRKRATARRASCLAAQTRSPSWTSCSRTRCGSSIRSCPSSPRNSGRAWASRRTCPRIRAARRSCSRPGRSRSTDG